MKDPFIISSIILAFTFMFLLIYNNILKNKIIKIIFLILSFIYLTLIIIFDNKYIYEVIKFLITYIWYPPYILFVTTILFSIINFIYTLLNKLNNKQKIINYFLFCLNFSCYITFLRLNIDLNSYTSYYANNSLTILRITSISFLVWFILTIIITIIDRRKDEK